MLLFLFSKYMIYFKAPFKLSEYGILIQIKGRIIDFRKCWLNLKEPLSSLVKYLTTFLNGTMSDQ